MAGTQGVALVGIGKIAIDQHVPAIAADPRWHLAATVSRHGRVDGVPAYTDIAEMLAAHPEVALVSLCTPPVARHAHAAAAIAAGRHVMLEKPPAATLAEIHDLQARASAAGVSLFATWHSRHAHAVAAARDRLAGTALAAVDIVWKEDVRRWHPGQEWIWEPGGLGVLDPGINALSILTAILPRPVHLTEATLEVPAGRQAPIAAALRFADAEGLVVTAALDWRQEGPQSWDIVARTDVGTLRLSQGGARLEIDGVLVTEGPDREYPGLYARMADLVAAGASDVDLAPMVHVCDACTLGRRVETAPFAW